MKRTALVWIGAALSPLLLDLWVFASQAQGVYFGLSFLVPIASLLLLLGAVRRQPFVLLAVVIVNMVFIEFGGPGRGSGEHQGTVLLHYFYLDVIVGYTAADRRRLTSVLTAVGVGLVQTALSYAGDSRPTGLALRVGPTLIAVLTAWLIGNTVRQRRLFTEARVADVARAAVQAERLRIARELHDMVAHSMGVIAMQAGMGRRVIATQPEEAGKALAVIEDTGRETLAALRRMLGSLRQAEPVDGEPVDGAVDGGPPVDPAPGLDDLDRLVDSSRAAGLRVDLEQTGDSGPLPPDVELSAYRIIQEAVTNVARHAGTDHCRVVVDREPEVLVVEVVDQGRGGEPGPGYGIAGMRERVSLLGGQFAAGPRPEGGFAVSARLPIPADAR
jgi:signal transduction histidine kinase